MTGPRQELADTGRLGSDGAELLYRTVVAVAAARNFPPPTGSASWDESAVAETAHNILDGPRGVKRLADALLRSTDESSFARILEGAAVNYLRDVARRTDLGKVILRVAEVLRSGDEFIGHGGNPPRWGLPGGPTAPSHASPAELARTAGRETNVVVPAWASDRRDPPIANRDTLVRILTRVLSSADGGVTAVDAARAVAARIDIRRTPMTVELDVLERVAEPAPHADPAISAVVSVDAARLFERLDDRERILLAGFHLPLEEAAAGLALGRSQSALLRQRLIARLRRDLGIDLETGMSSDYDQAQATLTARALRDLCAQWTENRTETEGATSNTSNDEKGGNP